MPARLDDPIQFVNVVKEVFQSLQDNRKQDENALIGKRLSTALTSVKIKLRHNYDRLTD